MLVGRSSRFGVRSTDGSPSQLARGPPSKLCGPGSDCNSMSADSPAFRPSRVSVQSGVNWSNPLIAYFLHQCINFSGRDVRIQHRAIRCTSTSRHHNSHKISWVCSPGRWALSSPLPTLTISRLQICNRRRLYSISSPSSLWQLFQCSQLWLRRHFQRQLSYLLWLLQR